MAADLLDLDPGGLVERKAADAGAEGDQRQRAGAELVGDGAACWPVAARMISAEVGPPRCIVAAWITHRHGSSPAPVATAVAEADRRALVALGLDRRAAGPRDRTGDAAAVAKLGVGRVGDRVDLEPGDVRVPDLDLGHRPPG